MSAIGAALLTEAGVHGGYAVWVLPGLVLIGGGMGLALTVAIAMGSVPDSPEDAGAAGSMTNVGQQVGAPLGIALISTFVASATTHYLHHHLLNMTAPVITSGSVHGYSVGYWWAAGCFLAAAGTAGAIVKPTATMAAATGVE